MKKCLGNDKIVNDGDISKKIQFGEKDFLNAVKLISDDIMKKYSNKKIGLIGIARGGAPLLVAVSHQIGIREVSFVQIQMTNSNDKWDYGKEHILNGYIDDSVDEYIIFEDMVSHGRSINLLVNELTKRNKKILDIYTLFLNSDMLNLKIDNEYMDINYVNIINANQWVYFFWEKGYK